MHTQQRAGFDLNRVAYKLHAAPIHSPSYTNYALIIEHSQSPLRYSPKS